MNLRIVRDGRVGSASTNRLDERRARRARPPGASRPPRARAPSPASPASRRRPSRCRRSTATTRRPPRSSPRPSRHRAGGDRRGRAVALVRLRHERRDRGRGRLDLRDRGRAAPHRRDGAASSRPTRARRATRSRPPGRSARSTRPRSRARPRRRLTRTRGARTIEPGHYRAVLEPYAIGELLQHFAYDSFSALGLIEQRSFLAGRLGERRSSTSGSRSPTTRSTRPGCRRRSTSRASPKQRVAADRGRRRARRRLGPRDRRARRRRRALDRPCAAACCSRDYGPAAVRALGRAGGEADSVEELAELVGEGIYVTRLHYLSIVEPREGVITGMTRDGTFRIRGGQDRRAARNLRFTVSVPEMLADVPGLTRRVDARQPERLLRRALPVRGARVPALATARFTISGDGSSPGI